MLNFNVGALRSFVLSGCAAILFLCGTATPGQAQTPKRSPYLQNVTPNSITVDWVTTATGTSTVRYGTTTSYGQETAPVSPTSIAAGFKHAVTIAGLTPNTKYFYQIVTNGSALSPAGDAEYFFKTSPPIGSNVPFSFAVIGDMGTPGEGQAAVADLIDQKNPDFVIAVGDIVYDYSTSNADSMYFQPYAKSMKNIVFYPTCGNHDTGSGSECNALITDHSLPQGGRAAGPTYDSSYSFDYGNMHLATYNSTPTDGGSGSYNAASPQSSTPEFKWLYNDLKASNQPWKVSYWHHNGWSAGTHSGSFPPIINNPVKVSQDTGVNLVYWGHSHVFERFGRYPLNTGPAYHTVGNSGQGSRAKSCGAYSNGPTCLESNRSPAPLYGMLFVEVNGNTITQTYLGRDTTSVTAPILTSTPVTYTTTGGQPPTPDTTPPAVSLAALPSTISGTQEIVANASDNSGSLNRVEFYIDGVLRGTDTIAGPYSFTWATSQADNGSHSIYAKAYDNASPTQNSATSATVNVTVNTTTPVDTTPPVISAIAASAITATGATITWTTDESANTTVEYGTATPYTGSASGASSGTSHSVTLTGLSPATTYHYRVISADISANHNSSASTDRTFTTLSVVGPTPTPNPNVTGANAWWKLDEGIGLSAADSSGNNNSGTLVNSPSWVTGKKGQALDFDGLDDTVTFSAQNQSVISISAWVASDSMGESAFPRILETNGWRLFYARSTGNSLNTVGFRSARSSTSGEWRTAPESIADNTAQSPWTHIAVTYDSSSESNDPKIYINGVAQTVNRTTAPVGTQTANAGTGYIGNSPQNDRTWNGKLDEVRIFSSILSDAEVQALFQDGGTPPATDYAPSNPQNLREYSEGGQNPGDTELPQVTVGALSTVSGTVSVTASASDNVGVAGVQFKLDGANLGAEDTSSPYAVSWNTTGASNGAHSLTAVARDAAGNTRTSASVAVTVNNQAGNATYPAQVLDLTNWKETLPIGSSGSPTEIKQPQLATYSIDPYFIVAPGGAAVRFRAPTNGVTTSGSSNPRSELREMANGGTSNASWTNSSGTHTMIIDQAVTHLPDTKKHIVVGQIHDASDDVVVFRLEDKHLFVNAASNGTCVDSNGGTSQTAKCTLTTNYTLGTRFTVKFVAVGGKIYAYYNGGAQPAFTMNASISGAYFKAGAYTQANCGTESACGPNNYGENDIFGLTVTHVP